MRATKPLDLGGTIVRGLEVRFEGGRAVDLRAESGGEALRARTERDEGAARLGEVALVDRDGRIGPLDTVFYDTLLDENAASHIALGRAYSFTVDESDQARANDSAIHIDFMIGGEDVSVTGVRPTARTGVEGRCDRRRAAAASASPRRVRSPAATLSLAGEVPEWLNGRDWKSRNGGQPRSRVRIPPSPSPPGSVAVLAL